MVLIIEDSTMASAFKYRQAIMAREREHAGGDAV